jgi:RHS repeat-associated protein
VLGYPVKVVENSGKVVEYTYDELDRLVQEKIADPINGNLTLAYNYDAVSNRVSLEVDGVTYAYSYDANNRLLSAGDKTYGYDANGNTLSQTGPTGSINYGYDFKNQLVSASTPDDSMTYAYDAGGIRVSRSVNGAMTRYLVDQNRPYAQVLEEQTDNSVASYTFGNDLLSQKRGMENRYFHYDHLGSTRHLTDESETVTDAYDYQAFGEPLSVTGGTVNPYLFTGEQHDPETGLVYLRARYYDPGVGRFLTRDTWNGRRGEPISLHKYLYANGNPVVFVDPTGHDPSLMSLSVGLNMNSILVTMRKVGYRQIVKWLKRKKYHVFKGTSSIPGISDDPDAHHFVYVEKKFKGRGDRYDVGIEPKVLNEERDQITCDIRNALNGQLSSNTYPGFLRKSPTSRRVLRRLGARIGGKKARFTKLQYILWQNLAYEPYKALTYSFEGRGNCQSWTAFALIMAKIIDKMPWLYP